MKTYTVAEVAKLSRVTVKALHHYDEIGLLKPAFIGENRYRYYGRDELLRLQQIMFHRELDIPLADIGALLDRPDFDRVAALKEHRARLEAAAKRYRQLIRTIDRMIAQTEGEKAMSDADLYKGFSPEKQAGYEAWLIDRYGGEMPISVEASRKKVESLKPAEMERKMIELAEIEQELAEGLRRGVPPQATALDPLLVRHNGWVAFMWNKPCPPEAYAGLADLYVSHPDFTDRHEAMEVGFAEYLATAMKAWAKRQNT